VNEWLQWVVVICASFGLAAILRDGEIFAWLRSMLSGSSMGARFVRCWLCLGWWSAWPIAWQAGMRGKILLLAPFVVSGVAYIVGTWLSTMQIEDL